MTESFTETMRRDCAAIWDAQLTHPFVVALADGTLPRETFQFYILQDARFLTDLAKTFAFAATKTDEWLFWQMAWTREAWHDSALPNGRAPPQTQPI